MTSYTLFRISFPILTLMRKCTLIVKLMLLCIVNVRPPLIVTISDCLALHDIWHDYVSKKVLESHGGNSALNLPEWSETKMEWQIANISGLIRIACFIFSSVTLALCLKVLKKKV